MQSCRKILVTIVLIIVYSVMLVMDSHAASLEVHNEAVGFIYLGDSRFVGMNNYVHMDEMPNTFVVAKSGEGFKWLHDTATYEISFIMNEHDEIDQWYLITGLGVNDYWRVDEYIEFYSTYDDMDDVKLICLSVNPVEPVKCRSYGYDYERLPSGIEEFNTKLNDTDYTYVDTNTSMLEHGFNTVDGIHYTEETYEYIYSVIEEYVAELRHVNKHR